MRFLCDKRLRRGVPLILLGVLLLAISVPCRFWALLAGVLAVLAGLMCLRSDG